MSASSHSSAVNGGVIAWLDHELAPSPERLRATARMVITAAIIVVTSTTLDVPYAATSAYMGFFVTKHDPKSTTRTAIVVTIGMTISIALTLLLYRATVDVPPLGYASMAAVLFTGMWLSRVSAFGPLAFLLGFAICATQSIVDQSLPPELYVRAVLWLWVAVTYPVVLTAFINQFLFRADATGALRAELGGWRRAVAAEFESLAADAPDRPAAPSELWTIATTAIAPADADPARAAILRSMDGTSRLARDVAGFALVREGPLSGDMRQRFDEIRKTKETDGPDRTAAVAPAGATPAKRHGMFVPDTWTNPAHSRFAFKATLAAMICYTIYTGLDWFGIHTALITSVFVVLGSSGATLHKSALRITGCLIGAAMGFLAILFLVPQLEGITGLVLLVSVGSIVAAWVASGSERTAYAGLQIGLAFFLCVVQGQRPETNFDAARDRVVGILLGVLVTGAIFTALWPERASDARRASLASVLRRLAALVRSPRDDPEAAWSVIRDDLSRARKHAELELFEGPGASDGASGRRQVDEAIELALRTWTVTRAWRSSGDARSDEARLAAADALESAAQRFERAATGTRRERPPEPAPSGRSGGPPAASCERLMADAGRLGWPDCS